MLLEKARYAAFCRDVQRIIQISQDIFVADKKYFYHSFISPCFAPKYPVLQGISGIMVIRSEITDCGKSEQNPASCYYLLVVKLVVKGKFLLLRVFLFILHQPKYFIPFFLITPLIIF